MHGWILQVSGLHVFVTFFVAQFRVCSSLIEFFNWESLLHSASCSLCFLACFAVHCCVSKLYWHSLRLLPLPHHLCCSPSLFGPLSPEWLTRIFNFSVYLSLLCLKQHWYRLRARWRLGWCICVCVCERRCWCRRRKRGDTQIGWSFGGKGMQKWKRCKKREQGFLCWSGIQGWVGGGVIEKKRSKWVGGVEEELRWYFCTVTQTDSAEGIKGEWEERKGKEWTSGNDCESREKVRWSTEH